MAFGLAAAGSGLTSTAWGFISDGGIWGQSSVGGCCTVQGLLASGIRSGILDASQVCSDDKTSSCMIFIGLRYLQLLKHAAAQQHSSSFSVSGRC